KFLLFSCQKHTAPQQYGATPSSGVSPGWDGTRDQCACQGGVASQRFPASDRSTIPATRGQNGSNNTVITAGRTATLPKLVVVNPSLAHKAVYCSTTCYGSAYFRHCSTQCF